MRVLGLLLLVNAAVFGQAAILCQTSSVPATARAEGLAEQTGDIVLNCQGAPPNATITANFNFFFNTEITNRQLPDTTLDVILKIDRGDGSPVEISGSRPRLFTPSAAAYSGVSIRFNAQGAVGLTFSNFRANMLRFPAATGGPSAPAAVRVNLAVSAIGNQVTLTEPNLTVAFTSVGLRSSALPGIIDCRRQAVPPTELAFADLVANSVPQFTLRATEGFPTAFSADRPQPYNTGTRLRVRYSGIPEGLRLFAPDVIVGSSGIRPTSAGAFRLPPASGRYEPTVAGSLLLVRVTNPNPDGSAGDLAYQRGPVGSGAVDFSSVRELPSLAGRTEAVYEVVDAAQGLFEAAQIVTFAFPTPDIRVDFANVTAELTLAPVSTLAAASTSAPIPRYRASAPPADCELLGDCGASYLPRLRVDAPSLVSLGLPQGGGFAVQNVPIRNDGGGTLSYTVSTSYSGTTRDWLQTFPDGPTLGPRTLILQAKADGLPVGIYRAEVFVNAGSFGSARIPVEFTVAPPSPKINAIVSAANLQRSEISAGSLATLFGQSFGSEPSVTFDGIPARILFANSNQINLLVPSELGTRPQARVVAVSGPFLSPAVNATLQTFAPHIFPNAVLKADSTFPNARNPANTGSVLQVFATGLLDANGQGFITAHIHDRRIARPDFAGAAPGLFGVQQVNFAIPADLPTTSTEVRVCVSPDSNEARAICSTPIEIWIRQP
jgi:uncharacterized protein (TIGR03437 family)